MEREFQKTDLVTNTLILGRHVVYIDLHSEPTLRQALPTALFNRVICERTPSKLCK